MELPFVFACLFVVSLIDVYSQIIFIFQVGESARPLFCFFDEFGEYASEASARKRKQNNSSFFFPHLHPLTLALNKFPVGHTIPDTFCAATKIKPYQIGPLFTHKNCKLSGAISVTEQSCAVPISKLKWSVTNRIGFGAYFGAVWTLIWPVAEVNKQERGLKPTGTEVNIQGWILEFNGPNPPGQPLWHDVRRVVSDLCHRPFLFIRCQIAFCGTT